MISDERRADKLLNKKWSFSKTITLICCLPLIIVLAAFLICLRLNYTLISAQIGQAVSSYSITQIDLNGFAYAIPSAAGLAGIAIAAYTNKGKLENSIKIRYTYIVKLLSIKKSMGLYRKEELINQIDDSIRQAESGSESTLSQAEVSADQEESSRVG